MIRTQVYLTEEQARDIKLKAKRENKREAEVIRELLSNSLKTIPRARRESTGESLLRLRNWWERPGRSLGTYRQLSVWRGQLNNRLSPTPALSYP
jgi:hypothetical protein